MFNFRVRDGFGWFHAAVGTKDGEIGVDGEVLFGLGCWFVVLVLVLLVKSSTLLVLVSLVRCRACTSSLFPGGLPGVLTPFGVGKFILESASRLDAFSAYPVRAWLLSLCPWWDS